MRARTLRSARRCRRPVGRSECSCQLPHAGWQNVCQARRIRPARSRAGAGSARNGRSYRRGRYRIGVAWRLPVDDGARDATPCRNQPAKATVEFEATLRTAPNRSKALSGATCAAKRSGDGDSGIPLVISLEADQAWESFLNGPAL